MEASGERTGVGKTGKGITGGDPVPDPSGEASWAPFPPFASFTNNLCLREFRGWSQRNLA